MEIGEGGKFGIARVLRRWVIGPLSSYGMIREQDHEEGL